jgi:hypothetical protein
MVWPNFRTEIAEIAQSQRHVAPLWRGRDVVRPDVCPTGHASLDALLPGEGWPVGAVAELIAAVEGIGELTLPLPALKHLCAQRRQIVFVSPPHIPYAPALARAGLPLHLILWIDAARDEDARWAAEQTLREGAAGAVLLWSETAADKALRRLQLAAEEGRSLAFVYRPSFTLRNPSPAALRIVLSPAPGGLHVEVVKARGGRGGSTVLKDLRNTAR